MTCNARMVSMKLTPQVPAAHAIPTAPVVTSHQQIAQPVPTWSQCKWSSYSTQNVYYPVQQVTGEIQQSKMTTNVPLVTLVVQNALAPPHYNANPARISLSTITSLYYLHKSTTTRTYSLIHVLIHVQINSSYQLWYLIHVFLVHLLVNYAHLLKITARNVHLIIICISTVVLANVLLGILRMIL